MDFGVSNYRTAIPVITWLASIVDCLQFEITFHQLLAQFPQLLDHVWVCRIWRGIAHLAVMEQYAFRVYLQSIFTANNIGITDLPFKAGSSAATRTVAAP
jgi:hypothetical protein